MFSVTTSHVSLIDVAVYGWRSAEVVNLSRMRKGSVKKFLVTICAYALPDFANTQQIFLEQNYRSTAAILRSCLAIVSEGRAISDSNHEGC